MTRSAFARRSLATVFIVGLAACHWRDCGSKSECEYVDPTPIVQTVGAARLKGGTLYTVTSDLPTTGAMSASSFMFSTRYQLDPLTATPQTLTKTIESVSPTLPLPAFSLFRPGHVLVGGAVHTTETPDLQQERAALSGAGVNVDVMAADHTTVHSTVQWETLDHGALSGKLFSDAPMELQGWQPFHALSVNPMLLKPGAKFLPGAAYFKRKTHQAGDTVFVFNCPDFTSVTTPEPVSCAGPNVESLFPMPAFGRTYQFTDGKIQTVQGLRAWISNDPAPGSTTGTATYPALIERNGQVTAGTMQRDGTPIRSLQADGSTLDYSLIFNQEFIESLRGAVAF